jgi:hypothetical protein
LREKREESREARGERQERRERERERRRREERREEQRAAMTNPWFGSELLPVFSGRYPVWWVRIVGSGFVKTGIGIGSEFLKQFRNWNPNCV